MKMIKRGMNKGVAVAALMSVCVVGWGFGVSAQTNLALGKTVVASSTENAVTMPGSKITDGDTVSKWGSNYALYPSPTDRLRDSAWVYVDFGSVTTFDSIEILWEHSAALVYNVQTATTPTTNDQGWTTIAAITGEVYPWADGGPPLHRRIKLATPANSRYLKVRCVDRNFEWGFSMYEIRVFNTQGTVTPPTRTNVALNKTGTASSTRNNGNIPNKAFDGAYGATLGQGSRWETAWDNQPNIDSIRGNCWLAVDLGAKYTIDSVAIYWEHSGSGKFAIQVPKSDALPLDSSDAGWTTLVIDTTLKFQPVPVDMGITQLKLPAPTTTRYVRVHSYKRLAGDEFAYGISIEEFEVYGVPATSIKPATQIRTTSSDLTLTTTKTGVSIKANDYNQRTTTADIFAPNGQLVRHLSGTESSFWNYKDNFGSKVTNGTYMIRLTSAGKTYQDKITVNR